MFGLFLLGVHTRGGPPGLEFLGEQPVAGFINGEELASAIGLSSGTAQHSDEPWLHFRLDDVILYVAKKPYRRSLTWNSINSAGAVFGTKTIDINGKTYKVRLLKTVATGNRYTGGISGYDKEDAYGSEWNRLMYPIHSGIHTQAKNPTPVSGEGIEFGTLAKYTDSDLITHNTTGDGSRTWCQETPNINPASRVHRGDNGVSHLEWNAATNLTSSYGWRPVLELVD